MNEPLLSEIEDAKKINVLINQDKLSTTEASNAKSRQIDELAQRFEQLQNMSTKPDISEVEIRAKVETILGLGSPKDKPNKLKVKIGGMITATYLALKYPKIFAGLVLYGSRTNPEKIPSDFSDQDIALIINPNIKSAADIPIEEIDFINVAEHFAAKVFGVKTGFSTIWGTDLIKAEIDNQFNERVKQSNKNIDINSIPIIPNSEVRKAFKIVFGEQLQKPQSDFRPDLISSVTNN